MSIKRRVKDALRGIIMLMKEREMIPIPAPVSANSLLEGKTALLTGGSGGIGRAIAKAFLRSGAKVIIAGTNSEKLSLCLQKLHSSAENAVCASILLDVLDVESMPGKVS